jgi:hypothetical protein
MTEEVARARYGDATETLEGTLEIRYAIGGACDMHRVLTAMIWA